VRPARLVDEQLPEIIVDGLFDASDARGGYDELAFVAEQYVLGWGGIDAVLEVRDESCFVVPAEFIAAVCAVADIACPAQIEETGLVVAEIAFDEGVEFARVVDVGLEEDGSFGEVVPAIENVVEVCFGFSSHVWELNHLVRIRFLLDLLVVSR
jgi:hypothetical protein